jgi:hypothetical protein
MLFMLVYITAIMTLQYAVIYECCFDRGLVCFISTPILFPYGAVVLFGTSCCDVPFCLFLCFHVWFSLFYGFIHPSCFNVWLRCTSGCIIKFFAGSYFASPCHRLRDSSFGTITRIQDGRPRNFGSLFPAASKPSLGSTQPPVLRVPSTAVGVWS